MGRLYFTKAWRSSRLRGGSLRRSKLGTGRVGLVFEKDDCSSRVGSGWQRQQWRWGARWLLRARRDGERESSEDAGQVTRLTWRQLMCNQYKKERIPGDARGSDLEDKIKAVAPHRRCAR